MKELTPEEQMRVISRRSFAWGAVGAGVGVTALKIISSSKESNGIPGVLRSILDANGNLAGSVASNNNLSEIYPRSMAKPPRTNGRIGLKSELPTSTYQVRLEAVSEPKIVSIDEILSMQKSEVVTKFKCVEGWSSIVQAAGVKFSDFLQALSIDAEKLPNYCYLTTPDEDYYVGLDKKALLHPQTLLAWEMDGKPLLLENGAPLRLFIPTKYGIKNLKRVGLIRFQETRPTDYWYERGYDWYAGL